MHFSTSSVQLTGRRVGNGAAQTAADDAHFLKAIQFTGCAQRAYKIVHRVTCFQAIQFYGACPEYLVDDTDRPLLGIRFHHRKGDAL